MLVANVVPNWQDDQGQMTRRIVYFDFSKKPPLCNSQLAAELKEPTVLVQILLRCSKAYRELAVRYKSDGIMPNILAKYYPRRADVGSKSCGGCDLTARHDGCGCDLTCAARRLARHGGCDLTCAARRLRLDLRDTATARRLRLGFAARRLRLDLAARQRRLDGLRWAAAAA
ncbi:hypothetical protein T492DRAFT_860602 [Pavlovales sp. CCMP2436]|nr:hypothetical protein T492DRAFT_860602 [Pavlovales sp. CCMP2436]